MKGNDIKQRIKKVLGVVLIAGGIMLLLYPLFTHLYSNIIQWRELKSIQLREENSIDSTTRLDAAQLIAEESQVNELKATKPKPVQEIPQEFSEAVLEIPSLKLTTVVLKGTSQEVLAKAPGWYEESALPGQGNTAIAGHLNTYGSWFRDIGKLKEGDEITLRFVGRTYLYKVERVFPVKSTDWSIVDPVGYNALTLSTCIANDRSRRLIVRAREVSLTS